jgi:hypothetical protein
VSKWRNQKVEQFSQQDYEKFWKQYLREQVKYICKICNKPIQKRNMVSHMERNHDEKYEQHNQDVENRLGDTKQKGGES